MKKFTIIALCIACVCSLVCLVACVNNASNVTASAAEETQATNVVYRNYEISILGAPLHFFIPYSNYQTLSPSVNSYFTEDILTYQNGTSGYLPSMEFVFQVIDGVGNIYYENVARAGCYLNSEINENGQYRTNSNSYVGVTFDGSVSSLYALTSGGRVFAPSYTVSSNYPFKIYVSSEGAIDVTALKIRSCALHDLQVYGASDERIWADYTLSTSSSTNRRILQIVDAQATDSSSPLYPVQQSPSVIYNQGYNEGYRNGYEIAMDGAYQDGYNAGYSNGNTDGYRNGYANGESAGYNQGVLDSNDYSFLSLTSAVFDAPVTILTEMLNFEILGFNMRTLVLSLLSLALVFGLIKLFI